MLEVVLSVFADSVIVLTFMLAQFNALCREWPHWIRCRLHSRTGLSDHCCSICVCLLYWQFSQLKTVYDEAEVGVPLDACMSVKLGLSQQGKIIGWQCSGTESWERVCGWKREEETRGWRGASWFVLNTSLGWSYQEGEGMWHVFGGKEMHS